ncbi:MAG: hypothetical protein ABW185_04025 [Sedimenticola sp.]
MKGIKNNEMEILYVNQQVRSNFQSLERTFSSMMTLLTKQVTDSNHINHQFDELKLAVIDLVKGQLSPILIPPQIIKSTMKDVQKILDSKFNGFYLSHNSPQNIYSSGEFLYARSKNKLYITIKFPLTHLEQPMDLFKPRSFAVPVNSTSTHATKLLDLPEYFLITHDQQYYATVSTDDLAKCNGNHVKHCPFGLPLTPITTETCLLALFSNNKNGIHNLCDFRFVHSTIEPNIIELSPTSLIVYRTPLLTLRCSQHQRMVKGCDFCVIKLPCLCSVTTARHYVAPRLTGCHNETQNITKLHPFNLILLQEFFDDKTIRDIHANTLLDNPLNVSVPHFKLYEHKMSSILADDQKNHLSLSKMADAAKRDAMIFRTLADPLLNGDIALQTDWPDTNAIMIFATMAVCILASIFSIWAFFKIRALTTALLVLQRVNCIKASSIPSFIYPSLTEAPEEGTFQFNISLSWDHAIFATCVLILCLTIMLAVKIFKRTPKALLSLEVTNGKDFVMIPILVLPACPSHTNIQCPSSITNLDVTGSWYAPILTLSWPKFSVQDLIGSSSIEVSESIKLTLTQGYCLRAILKHPFFVYIHIQHNGLLIPLGINKEFKSYYVQ